MENIEDNTSIVIGLALPISVRYPPHHPNLAPFLALFDPEPALQRDGQVVIPVAIQDDRVTNQFVVSISENLHESTTISEEELAAEVLPTELESPNNQIQLELPSMTTGSELDGERSQHTTRYLAPINQIQSPRLLIPSELKKPHRLFCHVLTQILNKSHFLLRVCLPLYISVLVKAIPDGHSHSLIVNLLLIISTFAYGMAYLDLCVLFWMYERLGNSNLSHQKTYLRYYRILKDAYYISCALVIIFSLLPVIIIFIPLAHPHHH